MNEARKKLWVDALRSGDYKQTAGGLHDRDGFCCLGVACDVYVKETGLGEWKQDPDYFGAFLFEHRGVVARESSVLPSEVARWYGLADMNPAIPLGGFKATLAHLNDGVVPGQDRCSFTKIADLIEEYL